MKRRLIACAAAGLTLTAATTTGCRPPSAASRQHEGTPPAPSLAELRVTPESSKTGYTRAQFGRGWDHHGKCDTRELVINRGDPAARPDHQCKVRSGHWTSDYDGTQVTNPRDLDIDHLVPLAEAWRSGASSWTPQQRQQFANDLQDPQLLAVSASSNRAKGDQDPGTWRPSNHSYWCTYATNYSQIKKRFNLTVDQREYTALADMLATCPTAEHR